MAEGPRLSDLASWQTCDICGRGYPVLGRVPSTVPEGACSCGGTHAVCVGCIRLLELPWAGHCPAASEVRTAVALMRDDEDPEAKVLRELWGKGLL